MTVAQLCESLSLRVVAGRQGIEQEVKGIYIGDLLSLVMAHAKKGDMWLTVQGHINSVAVAVLDDLVAIVLVESIEPNEEMKQKADEEGIPILVTSKSSYEMAKALANLL